MKKFCLFLAICMLLALLLAACSPATQTEPPATSEPTRSESAKPTASLASKEPSATEPSATEPPVTEPPATEPTVTEPPITESAVTEPPVTQPPATEPPVTQPPVQAPEYAYDLGTVIVNPTEADIQSFYDMIYHSSTWDPGVITCGTIVWASRNNFVSAEADASMLMSLIAASNGDGLWHEFSFEEEYIEPPGDEGIYSCRYKAEDMEWIMQAVFGREMVRNPMPAELGRGEIYYQDGYYYRAAAEMHMGNPDTYVNSLRLEHEKLGDGSYRFRVDISMQGEFDPEPSEVYSLEYVAIPMYSQDLGIYWSIVSFVNHSY